VRSPDGRWLALGGAGVALVDPDTGEAGYDAPIPCSALAWTPSGDLLCADDVVYRLAIGAGSTPPAGPMPDALPAGWPGPELVTVRITAEGPPVRVAAGGWSVDAGPLSTVIRVPRPADGVLHLTFGDPAEQIADVVIPPGELTLARVDQRVHFAGCRQPVLVWWGPPGLPSHRETLSDAACDAVLPGQIAGGTLEVQGRGPGAASPDWLRRLVAGPPAEVPATRPPSAVPPGAPTHVEVRGASSARLIGWTDAGASAVWTLDAPAIAVPAGRWSFVVFDGTRTSPPFTMDGAGPIDLPAPTVAQTASGRLVYVGPLPEEPVELRLGAHGPVIGRTVTDRAGRFSIAVPAGVPGLRVWTASCGGPAPAVPGATVTCDRR
jgi:hypothetical protein